MTRLFSHLLLIVTLLMGQQAALSHALAHMTGGVAGDMVPDKPLPSPDQCEKCASLSHLQAACSSPTTAPLAVLAFATLTQTKQTPLSTFSPQRYQARGPPAAIQS